MKTAISIPDELFRRAERVAKRRKISRSQLYAVALARLLDAEPKDDVTRAYDTAFDEDGRDSFVTEAGREALGQVEWTEE